MEMKLLGMIKQKRMIQKIIIIKNKNNKNNRINKKD